MAAGVNYCVCNRHNSQCMNWFALSITCSVLRPNTETVCLLRPSYAFLGQYRYFSCRYSVSIPLLSELFWEHRSSCICPCFFTHTFDNSTQGYLASHSPYLCKCTFGTSTNSRQEESQPQAQLLIPLPALFEVAMMLLVIFLFSIAQFCIWYIFDCQVSYNSYICMNGTSKLQEQESLQITLRNNVLHPYFLSCYYSHLKLIAIAIAFIAQPCFLPH